MISWYFILRLFKFMVEWFWIWLFLENQIACASLVGYGWKRVFQLKFHLEINCRSSSRKFALSFLSLTRVKRNVSSTNIFALDFNSPGKSLMYIRKSVDLKLNLGEYLLKRVSAMTLVYLKKPFGVYLIDSFEKCYKVLLRCPYS